VTYSTTPVRYDLPPPGLGEHSDEVRAWLRAPRTDRDEEQS
jgi:hypothetical protein